MVVRSARAGHGLNEWPLASAFFGTHKNQARRPVEFGDLRNDAPQVKMNLAHSAASRPRRVEARASFFEPVSYSTPNGSHPNSSSSAYAWKHSLRERIWTDEGPSDIFTGRLLDVLVEFADVDGRAWPGIRALLSKTKIKTKRTLQNALDELVRDGWLRIVRQTWASLTQIQTAARKRAPRRSDAGQATNLYIVLDGHGREVGSSAERRPGLARTSNNAPTNETPLQICPQGPLQNDTGGPPANLPPDLDQIGNVPKEESAERAMRIDPSTHISSKICKKDEGTLEAWNVLVETHAEKTKAAYGLPPLPPDLKRDQRQALAASLDGAAAEVRAKLHERTGAEREITEVRRELAARVMHLYFKRDNEHLRRVKHALRDLPREFHARITEAMQALLRESNDAAPPRRPQLEQPIERVVPADKPIEVAKQERIEQPEERPASADKPTEVVPPKATERVSLPSQPSPEASMNTAREARRLLDVLSASSPQQDLFRPSRSETLTPSQPQKPASPEEMRSKHEPAHTCADTNAQDKPTLKPGKKSFVLKKFEDKSLPTSQPTPRFEQPLGRSGASRWGTIAPRPTKVRRGSKLVPDDAESKEEHGAVSTPKT